MSEALASQIQALRTELTVKLERLDEKHDALAALVDRQSQQLAEINALMNKGMGIVLAITVFGALLAAGLKQWIGDLLK